MWVSVDYVEMLISENYIWLHLPINLIKEFVVAILCTNTLKEWRTSFVSFSLLPELRRQEIISDFQDFCRRKRNKVKSKGIIKNLRRKNFSGNNKLQVGRNNWLPKYSKLNVIQCSSVILRCRPVYWLDLRMYYLERLYFYISYNLNFILFSNIFVCL